MVLQSLSRDQLLHVEAFRTAMRIPLARCPSCHQPLEVTELSCAACELHVRGHFERGCRFCGLDREQRELLDVFLSCRGVLRDMEKALGVSYPTVRGRVDGLLGALGYGPTKAEAEARQEVAERRREILARLEAGELSAEEAAAALGKLAG